jgi:hypothetical protein
MNFTVRTERTLYFDVPVADVGGALLGSVAFSGWSIGAFALRSRSLRVPPAFVRSCGSTCVGKSVVTGRFAVIVVGCSVLVWAFEAGVLSLHPIANPQSTRTDAHDTFFNMKRILELLNAYCFPAKFPVDLRSHTTLSDADYKPTKNRCSEPPEVINYIALLVN